MASTVGVLEEVPTKLLKPSRHQLRLTLGDLTELKASIQEHGLLQPVVVRPVGEGFEIIAGHRRAESCRQLRWSKVPSYVVSLSDREAFESSVVENLQRQTLNPIEEARAFDRYVKEFGWGGVTELAAKIGKSPSYVSHSIKLLELSPEVKDMVASKALTRAHASELLWAGSEDVQRDLARVAARQKLSTSEIRQQVKQERVLRKVRGWDYESTPPIEGGVAADDKFRKKSIVILRIAMLRLDSLLKEIDEVAEGSPLKECLTNKRKAIHEMIDTLIKDDLKVKRYGTRSHSWLRNSA